MQKNIDTLDGIRGTSALIVFFGHFASMGMYADVKLIHQFGVMMFFALSGFLMAYLYSNSQFSIQLILKYLVKRFFRVYPAYVLVVLLSFLFAWQWGKEVVTREELLKHILLNGKVGVFWTIPVEMKFYVFFILFIIFYAFAPKLWKVIGSFGVWIGFLVFPFYGDTIALMPKIEFFMGGVAFGALFWSDYLKKNVFWDIVFTISIILIILSIPPVFKSIMGFEHRFWKTPWLFSPLMATCVFSGALSTKWVLSIFGNKVTRFLGKISYSFYLLHYPVLQLARKWLSTRTIQTALVSISVDVYKMSIFIAGLILAILVAYVFYRIIETPSRNLGEKLAKRIETMSLNKTVKKGV